MDHRCLGLVSTFLLRYAAGIEIQGKISRHLLKGFLLVVISNASCDIVRPAYVEQTTRRVQLVPRHSIHAVYACIVGCASRVYRPVAIKVQNEIHVSLREGLLRRPSDLADFRAGRSQARQWELDSTKIGSALQGGDTEAHIVRRSRSNGRRCPTPAMAYSEHLPRMSRGCIQAEAAVHACGLIMLISAPSEGVHLIEDVGELQIQLVLGHETDIRRRDQPPDRRRFRRWRRWPRGCRPRIRGI